MDFFDRQQHAQKRTRRLAWLFGVTVVAVLIINNLVLGALICVFTHPLVDGAPWHPASILVTPLFLMGEAVFSPARFLQLVLHWQTAGWVTFATLVSITAGSYYKIRQLSEGGSVVAEFLGGRRVESGTTDADERRLRNVIEEMAIASGTPVPEIYILDNERSINSFAAGHTRDDVAIGVTRGCVKLLTRDELQGIVAHEFSHILNGDTRLNMKLIGLAHGFFWPTLLGRALIYGSTDELPPDASVLVEEDQTKLLPTAPLGFVFVVLGYFSLPFVRLIKSAICRQREWLADAAAVQFTRNPAGIEGALKKIGGLFKQGRLDSPHAEVASHLYFANCDYDPWFGFLSTHPALPKRIAAIDPAFDGNFPPVKMLAPNQFERDQAFDVVVGRVMAIDRALPASVLALGDAMAAANLKKAALMRLNLPDELKLALPTPVGAAAIIYLLLLSEDESLRSRQMQILRTSLTPEVLAQTNSLAPQIEALGGRYKLVLAEYAVPALRENDPDVHHAFQQTIQQLVECEGSMDLFEYTLMKMVARQLRAHFEGPVTTKTIYGKVSDVLPECVLLLSALGHIGAEDETKARRAFAKGTEFLNAPTAAKAQFIPRSEWDLSKVDAALTRLSRSPDAVKKNILLACGKTVVADGQVTEREAELLRAIADSLNCAIPPFVEAIRTEELSKEASDASQ